MLGWPRMTSAVNPQHVFLACDDVQLGELANNFSWKKAGIQDSTSPGSQTLGIGSISMQSL